MSIVTKEQLQETLPATLKRSVTDNLVDLINTASTNPEELEQIRDNFISYTNVMRDGKYSIQEYLNAVKYVSFKLLQHTNQEAYIRTFPDRYRNALARGATAKDISSYVSAYNKGKLVNSIWEQTMIEPWVMYQDKYGLAVKALVDLIEDTDVSPHVRSISANSLLTHLAKPKEAARLNINIGQSVTEDTLDRLDKAMDRLASIQQNSIGNGEDAKSIAESNIIDGEIVE